MQDRFEKRYRDNCVIYILIYAFIGMMTGLIFDALITFLMTVSPDTAKSMASYMGIATFAASSIAILAPKAGYKRIIIFAAIVTSASLAAISYVQNQWLISACLFLLMTGITLFDVILSPYIATYTAAASRTSFMTKASCASVLGTIIGTFAGGPMIVLLFSKKLNIPYNAAKILTQDISSFSFGYYSGYIDAHRIVMMVFAAASILILIPAFSIRESVGDHASHAKEKQSSGLPELLNKYVVLFLIYTILSRFAASLIAPYVSVYLTKIGINRAAVSMLATLQYLSALVFMASSGKLVKKIGQIYAIAALCLASVPFMLILANGHRFGSQVELIVGTALFFRAGLANAAVPVTNSLTMELVPKKSWALYASLVFMMQSTAQIFAGLFTKLYLFNNTSGYADAYYYAAILYITAHGMLLAAFSKRYNCSERAECNQKHISSTTGQ